MGKRQSVGTKARNDILERDDYRCIKCSRFTNLEIHHIQPVVNGGDDNYANLITLCAPCHKYAPDNAIEFVKWAASDLTPQYELMEKVFLQILNVIRYTPELYKALGSHRDDGQGHGHIFHEKIEKEIRGQLKMLWQMQSNPNMELTTQYFATTIGKIYENSKNEAQAEAKIDNKEFKGLHRSSPKY